MSNNTKIRLSEGVWALPDDEKKVAALRDMLKGPLPPAKALRELYRVFGDDELFDAIGDLPKNGDARQAVKDRLSELLDQYAEKPGDFSHKLPDGVLAELKKLTESAAPARRPFAMTESEDRGGDAEFTLCNIGGKAFKGHFFSHDRWNGWYMPYFPTAEVPAIVEYLNKINAANDWPESVVEGGAWKFDAERKAVLRKEPGDESWSIDCEADEVDGDECYQIGAMDLTWSKLEGEKDKKGYGIEEGLKDGGWSKEKSDAMLAKLSDEDLRALQRKVYSDGGHEDEKDLLVETPEAFSKRAGISAEALKGMRDNWLPTSEKDGKIICVIGGADWPDEDHTAYTKDDLIENIGACFAVWDDEDAEGARKAMEAFGVDYDAYIGIRGEGLRESDEGGSAAGWTETFFSMLDDLGLRLSADADGGWDVEDLQTGKVEGPYKDAKEIAEANDAVIRDYYIEDMEALIEDDMAAAERGFPEWDFPRDPIPDTHALDIEHAAGEWNLMKRRYEKAVPSFFSEFAHKFKVLELLESHLGDVDLTRGGGLGLTEGLKDPLDDIAADRERMFEFPDGSCKSIVWDEKTDSIVAGDATNTGVMPDVAVKYDRDMPLDQNLEALFDAVLKKHPEFADDHADRRGDKINESKERLNEMLIDAILDRKDGEKYDPEDFYRYVRDEESALGNEDWPVSRALDSGTEENVKDALCAYVKGEGYNEKICDYVRSVDWLPKDESLKEAVYQQPQTSKEIAQKIEAHKKLKAEGTAKLADLKAELAKETRDSYKSTLENKVAKKEKELKAEDKAIADLGEKKAAAEEAEDAAVREARYAKVKKALDDGGKGSEIPPIKPKEAKAFAGIDDWLREHITSVSIVTSPKSEAKLLAMLPGLEEGQYKVQTGQTSGGYDMKYGISTIIRVDDLESCPPGLRGEFNDKNEMTANHKNLPHIVDLFDDIKGKIAPRRKKVESLSGGKLSVGRKAKAFLEGLSRPDLGKIEDKPYTYKQMKDDLSLELKAGKPFEFRVGHQVEADHCEKILRRAGFDYEYSTWPDKRSPEGQYWKFECEPKGEGGSLKEDTVRRGSEWMNKGKDGTHGKFRTKKAADAQRKAMFANGYKESLGGSPSEGGESDPFKKEPFSKALFSIEDSDIHRIPGWFREHDDWNGFAQPYFEKEAADEVKSAVSSAMGDFGKIEYVESSDEYWVYYSDFGTEETPDEVVKGENITTPEGERHVYPIGAGSWVWDADEER